MPRVTSERTNTATVKDYALFLNMLPFTHYGTFTTDYTMSLASARRAMDGFHKQISKAGQCYLFWVAEHFETKDGYHTHGLIQLPDSLSFSSVRQIWQHTSGGLNRGKNNRIDLQRYDRNRGANYYIGKYIYRKNTDYDILFSKE